MLCAYLSHKGRVRKCNEDYVYADDDKGLFVIADGMGGHRAGNIASRKAVDIIINYYNNSNKMHNNSIQSNMEQLTEYIQKANSDVYNMSLSNPQFSGMGTTITLLSIVKDKGLLAHVGDSRAYLIRKNVLKQLTTDHSLVEQMVKEGKITREEAGNHPQKNIITRALGTENDIEIDWFTFKLNKDDIIILCTDGLFNHINENEILDMVQRNTENIKNLPEQMIRLANTRGGLDNISVVIIKNDKGLTQEKEVVAN